MFFASNPGTNNNQTLFMQRIDISSTSSSVVGYKGMNALFQHQV